MGNPHAGSSSDGLFNMRVLPNKWSRQGTLAEAKRVVESIRADRPSALWDLRASRKHPKGGFRVAFSSGSGLLLLHCYAGSCTLDLKATGSGCDGGVCVDFRTITGEASLQYRNSSMLQWPNNRQAWTQTRQVISTVCREALSKGKLIWRP